MDHMVNLIKQVATLVINSSRAWPLPAGVLKITFKKHMLAPGSPFCHSYTVSDILCYMMMNFLLVLWFFRLYATTSSFEPYPSFLWGSQ